MYSTKPLPLVLLLAVFVAFSGCQPDPEVIFNVVPKADAGPSKSITLPVSDLTLTGSGTDADGSVVAYLWSQVAGPKAATLTTPGAATTAVSGFVAGNYIFQLMVTDDDGATGVDTISLKVNPAPEVTLTLQPVNNPADMVLSLLNGSNASGVAPLEIAVQAWTIGGGAYTVRSLMKFDLSSIPQSATILSANLYYYSHPAPINSGNFVDANEGSNNSLILQKASSDWTPAGINWFNQPLGSTQDQVLIPHTSAVTLDLNLDVKGIVSTMVSTSSNFGFLMKLQNENAYNCRVFVASSTVNYPTKRPKLEIVYRP
jgi:hypothetical protein